jgi:ATP-binding cassette subfamily B protein
VTAAASGVDVHDWKGLSQALRVRIEEHLEPGEYMVGCFAADLDVDLRYAQTLVVLTSSRLIASPPMYSPDANGAASNGANGWQSWPLEAVAGLRAHDRAGLGTLELLGPSVELAHWRYTISCVPAAEKFVAAFQSLRAGDEDDAEGEEDEEFAWSQAFPATAPRTKSLLRLAKFALPCLGLIILGTVLTLASTGLSLVPPYLTIPILDDILIPYQDQANAVRARTADDPEAQAQQLAELKEDEEARLSKLTWYLGALGGAALGAWLLAWAQGAVMAAVSERISANLRNETYNHLLRLSLEYFGGKRTGDLIARISSDTDRICTFLSDTALDFGTDVLMIVGTAAILVSIDPMLAVSALCPVPLIAWLIYFIRRRMQAGFARGGRTWSDMTSVLADSIPGIRVVKAFAQEQRESDRFRTANDRVVDANTRVNVLWTFFWPTVAMLNQLGLLVVWAFGAMRIFEFQITVGVLTAFVFYINRFYTRLESMSRMFSATQRAAVSAYRVLEILDQRPKVPDPVEPRPLESVQGRITFRNVGFRYGSRSVLNGIDLDIRPGEMIGLVGPSGAGKTTMINLVCRFYDVMDGGILVDGTDIRSFRVADYRRHIGLVLQEPFLFYGTVAENIAYGRPDATLADIVAAAKAARAHEFILRLPDGYDSIVGERGQSLSGGERQRISIARALLINPRILILDEATSSVDTETEREIQLALNNLIRGRTTIAIAHRLSTLRRADRLVVVERGQIVEVGPHDELLKRSGIYSRLYHAQIEMDNPQAPSGQRAAGETPTAAAGTK